MRHNLAKDTEGLDTAVEKLGAKRNPLLIVSAAEFDLESLHLKKDRVAGRYQYQGYCG